MIDEGPIESGPINCLLVNDDLDELELIAARLTEIDDRFSCEMATTTQATQDMSPVWTNRWYSPDSAGILRSTVNSVCSPSSMLTWSCIRSANSGSNTKSSELAASSSFTSSIAIVRSSPGSVSWRRSNEPMRIWASFESAVSTSSEWLS